MPPKSSKSTGSDAEYRLVNPQISNVNTSARASSPAMALKEIWGGVSAHLSSHVPQMHVTLQNKQTGGLSHHLIEEEVRGDKIDFKVSRPLRMKMASDMKEKFQAETSRVRREHEVSLNGGGDDDKKKSRKSKKDDEDDSSSSSSSSDDTYKKRRRHTKVKYDDVWLPPTQWWYAAMYGTNTLYVPTFISPLTPSIQISTEWVPMLTYV